jgi:D-sedoheptulose 7-phosphate isomerase
MSWTTEFLAGITEIVEELNHEHIDRIISILCDCRDRNGRLFILGVGGSAATASHAVGDFRKICRIEAYAPTDNVAELSARTNDDGWNSTFEEWLKTSRISKDDVVLVFSVGGGALNGLSGNLCRAISLAKGHGARVVGLVGRDGGYTAKAADACVVFHMADPAYITPHVEAMHGVLLHMIVTHPSLKVTETAWESKKQSF